MVIVRITETKQTLISSPSLQPASTHSHQQLLPTLPFEFRLHLSFIWPSYVISSGKLLVFTHCLLMKNCSSVDRRNLTWRLDSSLIGFPSSLDECSVTTFCQDSTFNLHNLHHPNLANDFSMTCGREPIRNPKQASTVTSWGSSPLRFFVIIGFILWRWRSGRYVFPVSRYWIGVIRGGCRTRIEGDAPVRIISTFPFSKRFH